MKEKKKRMAQKKTNPRVQDRRNDDGGEMLGMGWLYDPLEHPHTNWFATLSPYSPTHFTVSP